MQVHQFATSLSYGDAISDEMIEIRRALRERGFDSEIFIRFYEPRMAGYIRDFREYPRFSSPDNVVIFHFSIGSPVSKMFFRIPDRKIMIYHNITPHTFFLDYHRILAKECYKGRLELRMFRDKVDLALGDSEFNRLELEGQGYSPTGVLPLLLNFEKFDQPGDPVVRKIFAEKKATLLFVGRVIPNKRFEDVIKVYAVYKKIFEPRSRLLLVGDYRGMERYMAALQDLIKRLDVADVHFTGNVDFSELVAYFRMADVYLSMSAHEGFGVPLLEAFHVGLPVVALPAGAVEETMNGGGILIRRPDPVRAAALVDRIRRDAAFRETIKASQVKALDRYRRENTTAVLLEHITGLTAKSRGR